VTDNDGFISKADVTLQLIYQSKGIELSINPAFGRDESKFIAKLNRFDISYFFFERTVLFFY